MMKRIISFLLALVICLTCLPDVRLQARANDDEIPEATAAPEIPTEVATETPAPQVVSEDWTDPYKKEYIVNQEKLDTTGCTLTLTYSDGSQEVYDITPDQVSGFNNTVLGHQKLAVNCNGYYYGFGVTVIEEPKPQHIYFNGWQIKNAYPQGAPLDLTDGVIEVFYDNGNWETIPATDSSVTVSGYDPNLLGTQILTVSYKGLTADFEVTVYTLSGRCGDNLQYSFDEATGTLTITGSGAMDNFDWNTIPWRGFADQILTVELPDTLTALGGYAFRGCINLASVALPAGITEIPDSAFEECHALTSMTIPDTVKRIGIYAFSGAGLQSVTLPEGLETIDMYAFMSAFNLEHVELPESLKTLGGGAFQYCGNLETAELPETLDVISWHAFNECTGLQEITIPQSVTEISYFAFNSCTNLKDVTIPQSVTQIAYFAFNSCTGMTDVVFEGSAPNTDGGAMGAAVPFNNVTANAWYPAGDATWTPSAMASMGGNLTWKNGESMPSGGCGENLTWYLDASHTLHISGTGEMESYSHYSAPWNGNTVYRVVVHPGVTTIGSDAFFDMKEIVEVQLPDTLLSIGSGSFQECGALKKITFPDSLEEISWLAFAGCSGLESIVIPGTVNVGDEAFANCTGLMEVILRYGFTDLGNEVFSNCANLKTVILPEGLKTIGTGTFTACPALTEITIPSTVTEIHSSAFGRNRLEKSVTIDPEKTITFTGDAPEMEDGAFSGSVIIAQYPFGNLTWTADKMQDYGGTVTWVPTGSVAGTCGKNLNWTLEDGVLTISGTGEMIGFSEDNPAPWSAYHTFIEKVVVESGVTAIGSYAFYGHDYPGYANITELLLPDTLVSFGESAFEACSGLTSLTVPGSVTKIGGGAFASCENLETVVLSEGLQIISYSAFDFCSALKEITVPSTVTVVGEYAFSGEIGAEKTIHFTGNAPEFNENAFYQIVASVYYPTDDATWTADKMQNYGGTVTWIPDSGCVLSGTCGENVVWNFDETTGTLTISGNGNMYEWFDGGGSPWYALREQIAAVVIEEGVGSISPRAFEDCCNMESVSIPSTVETIHYHVFTGCISLQTVSVAAGNQAFCVQNGVLFSKDMTALIKYPAGKQNTLYIVPDSVREIREWAFEGNTWLKRVTLPDGMEYLEEGAFNGCAALTEITIPESVLWTNPVIFQNCTSLTKVVLPRTITWLGEGMFAGCTSLKTVVMPDQIDGIASGAFAGCTALEEITLPEGLEELWVGAFSGCTSLKSVTIPSTVNQYGDVLMKDEVFAGCTSLEWVIFNGPAPYFGDNAFRDVTATAVYPGNDVTWTDARKQNYGGNLTWKPMLSRLELLRYYTQAVVGEELTIYIQNTPSDAAADLTVTVTGAAELVSQDEKTLTIRGTAVGTTTVTATDAITGVSAVVSIPVVQTKAITCPGASDPFDLSFESKPIFTFTPTETKQYSLVLENVENSVAGYGEVALIGVVNKATNTDVMCDMSYYEKTSSQSFYTLEQGVTYQITPRYIGEDTFENVTLRISDVAEVTGIEIPQDTMTCYLDGSGIIDLITVEAFFRPVQAQGDITWTSSDPSVLEYVLQSENRAEFAGCQYGTAVVTASCGGYSDSVTVTVKEPEPLYLDTPFKTVMNNYPREAYGFTTEEAGWYCFTVTADTAMHLSGMLDSYSYDAEGRILTKLRANEAYILFVDGMEPDCDGAEYTLLAEKLPVPTGMTLKPSLRADGRVEIQAVFDPVGSYDSFDLAEWDNTDIMKHFSTHGDRAGADIMGAGEVTVTVSTKNGLMAARTLAVGSCGRDLYWMFDKASGTLTIAGSGAMYNYTWDGAPWKPYAEQILAVELPDTLTALGKFAFDGCVNLKQIQLPEGIPSIPAYAFNRCMSLTSLEIPGSVRVIGDTAFSECNSLTTLKLPEGLQTIENGAFYWANGLQEMVLPDSLTDLGGNAFLGCTALESVNIPESLDTISWATFQGCTSLKEITIPKSITEIAYHAFIDCTGLETVIFEGSAPSNIAGMNNPFWAPFKFVTADAWYPAGDATWTAEAMDLMGEDLRWIPNAPLENCIIVDAAELGNIDAVCIDGKDYAVYYKGGSGYIYLPDSNAKTMVAYTYHEGNPDDVHTRYPVSMKVWTLTNEDDVYTAIRQKQLDDILQYSGMSIRVYGKKGIRMITSIEQAKKNALTGAGLAGFTLKEYGTVLAWADQISDNKPLVLGKYYAKSNYAYKKGIADPVFNVTGSLMQYTNVLVNFSDSQCRDDIAMRPYIILEDGNGQQITLYGGTVQRSIGYIAYQNRNVFEPGTDEYEYVWGIIRYVYGTMYDDEYIVTWTPPAM